MHAVFRLLIVVLSLVVLAPTAWADDAPTTPSTEVADEAPRLADPLGKRFVRRAVAGLVPLPLPLAGVAGGFVGFAMGSEVVFVAAPVLAQGAAVAGGLGAAIALERATRDLQGRGVDLSPAALRVGHALLGTGTALALAAVPTVLGSVTLGLALGVAGGLITASSIVPYAIHLGAVREAYRALPDARPARTRSFSIAPTFDPVARTVGVRGTF